MHSLFLWPTTQYETNNIFSNLKTTAPGYDDINIKVIKACKDELSPFLKYIINKSFLQGCFPKYLQIAKVVPTFKKGDSSQFQNFRPVSTLPSISKIFEKIVATRLMEY